MIPIINKSIVPLKYRIGFTKHCPSKYDMLYELTEFLEAEHKEEFNEWELKNKTKSRVGTLEENIQNINYLKISGNKKGELLVLLFL